MAWNESKNVRRIFYISVNCNYWNNLVSDLLPKGLHMGENVSFHFLSDYPHSHVLSFNNHQHQSKIEPRRKFVPTEAANYSTDSRSRMLFFGMKM